MDLLAKAERNRDTAQHATNAIYFLRLLVKHLTENLNAAHLVAFVNDEPLQLAGIPNGSAGLEPMQVPPHAILHWAFDAGVILSTKH